MIGQANHGPGSFMGEKLKRGQLFRSYRTIANDCSYKIGYRTKKPSLDTVRRICEELTKDGRIELRIVRGGTIITVLNYDEMQCMKKSEPYDEQDNACGSSAAVGVQNKKNKECKEEINKNLSASGDAVCGENGNGTREYYLTKTKKKLTGKRLETFNQFWAAFNYRKGKAEAADAWLNIPQLTDSLVQQHIIPAAKAEAKNRPEILADGRTPIYAQGWINGRRWEDEDANCKALSWAEKKELERRQQENDGTTVRALH